MPFPPPQGAGAYSAITLRDRAPNPPRRKNLPAASLEARKALPGGVSAQLTLAAHMKRWCTRRMMAGVLAVQVPAHPSTDLETSFRQA